MPDTEKREYITQHDILSKIADERGLSKRQVYEVYNDLVHGIVDALGHDKEVRLTRFVTFDIVDRGPRKARNPHTGDSVQVPAKKVIKLRNKKLLHDAYLMNNGLIEDVAEDTEDDE